MVVYSLSVVFKVDVKHYCSMYIVPLIAISSAWSTNLLSDILRNLRYYGLFYDQGTRPVSFEVKNDVFQIRLILMFLYCR